MFQDDLIPDDQKQRYHDCYGRMADTVSESLRSYLWVLGHINEQFKATGKDTHLAVTLLLMEYADPIDGVSILARSGAAKNCVPLIRTGFELQLGLRFMMHADADFERRCLAYEFFHWQKQLKHARKCDPASQAGKQIRGQLKGTHLADAFDHSDRDIAAEIAALEKLADNPRYAAVKADYLLKAPKHWYGFWNGPANLEALAATLGLADRYEVFYRYWSGHAHGESAIKRVEENPSMGMDPLRCPRGLPDTCLNACNLANEMAAFLVLRFNPALQPELASRYLSRIKPGIQFIVSVKGL